MIWLWKKGETNSWGRKGGGAAKYSRRETHICTPITLSAIWQAILKHGFWTLMCYRWDPLFCCNMQHFYCSLPHSTAYTGKVLRDRWEVLRQWFYGALGRALPLHHATRLFCVALKVFLQWHNLAPSTLCWLTQWIGWSVSVLLSSLSTCSHQPRCRPGCKILKFCFRLEKWEL